MIEIWKIHPTYTDYALSNQGRVKRVTESENIHGTRAKVNNILSPRLNSRGYLSVFVCKDVKKFNKLVHRLVVETFIQNIPKDKEVNHKNGIKTDNRLDNLEITTRSANMKHAYANGLQKPIYEAPGSTKLTLPQIEKIKELYSRGNITQDKLAKQFNVTQSSIWRIINNKHNFNQGVWR